MYKWLTIMGIVCLGFIIVLLSLGYLLKENEVATKALKQKIDQQKQLNSSAKNPSKSLLTFVGSSNSSKEQQQINVEKINRIKNLIVKNITCASSEQCVLVNTGLSELNCMVAVNTIGASLLNKELGNTPDTENVCNVTYQQVNSVCKQNMCQLEDDSL